MGFLTGGGENHFLLRSGHCHVQNTEFLRQGIFPKLHCQHGTAQRVVLDAAIHIHIVDPDPQIHIRDQASVLIHPGELLVQPGHKGYRKLQPLTLVNAHDPNHIRILVQKLRLTVIHVILLQLLHIVQEMKQPGIAGALKIRRLRKQHLHIGAPLSSKGQCGHIIQVIKVDDYLGQQLPHGQISGTASIAFQCLQEILHLLLQMTVHSLFSVGMTVTLQAIVQRMPLPGAPDDRQLLLGKSAEIRVQHSVERNILSGIVQYPQDSQQFLHLRGAEIAGL